MYPELFRIPFTSLTIKSYGLMMVIAFLIAMFVIRFLSKKLTSNPDHITNAALYALIAGLIGARLFYVIHYFRNFKDNLLSVFAIWQGGLELLGGVFAILVIILYLTIHKLPTRQYLDIVAVGLMAALAFGRIGCFLNGCCYGKPADVPCAVSFPYGSLAYRSQVKPDLERNREKPYFKLPESFFNHYYQNGSPVKILKKREDLTAQQEKYLKDENKLRSLPVHPTELYSSLNGLLIAIILFLCWKRPQKALKNKENKFLTAPGSVFALMFILYAPTRFGIEFLRDDNPFGFLGFTVSQNISLFLLIPLGFILMLFFQITNTHNRDQ